MFKKLLSNLAFNPGLLEVVVFYGKNLKREFRLRVLGFTFILLAVIVQILASFYPAQNPFAESSNIRCHGSEQSQECSLLAKTAQNAEQFYSINPRISAGLGLTVLGISGYLLLRSRTMSREIEVIKKDYSLGGEL